MPVCDYIFCTLEQYFKWNLSMFNIKTEDFSGLSYSNHNLSYN